MSEFWKQGCSIIRKLLKNKLVVVHEIGYRLIDDELKYGQLSSIAYVYACDCV